ncbi:MAG: hypothetical protein H6Q49_1558, partial [Deltaproteobacteria bacterium]|nr:hypothetical protein [Deltaproteobacteria bacterium]
MRMSALDASLLTPNITWRSL